ncbi:MAG: hypothetical protein JAY74_03680 [Candidatus Thiodiazotropha taylori]|nr:hypothetical protein [Candidatus Thiodiazotropha taylori]
MLLNQCVTDGVVKFSPRVDWSIFTFHAGIDTIHVNVEFETEMHTNRARPLIKSQVGDSAKVISANVTDRKFSVSIQDPTPLNLHKLCNIAEVQIDRVDIALDLKGGDKKRLLEAVQGLAWMLNITNLGMDSTTANPRTFEDDAVSTFWQTGCRIGVSPLPQSPTYYFGHRNAPGSVRIYHKTMNEGQLLSADLHSARIEVTLAGDLLIEYGLDKISGFDSAQLSLLRQLFRFKLPIIRESFIEHSVTKVIFQEHLEPYLQVGVWYWDNKPRTRKRARRSEGTMRDLPHRRSQSFIELHKRVDKAFRRFEKRWLKGSVPIISPPLRPQSYDL